MFECDCNRVDRFYTDMGDYYLVVEVCADCGRKIREWRESK